MASTTVDFCAALLEAAAKPLPSDVAAAARRSLLNVLGTATSAATSDAVRVLLTAADEHGGAGDVTVPGLARTLDPYWGALVTGTAAHLDDFDDTHLATVIHPGASSLATVLSLVPETKPTGAAFLGAFAVGCEAQLRIGCAISPAHYDHGWHITGTCGVFGAAVAASVLLGLDAGATARALSLAATMTAGHREAFGTMTKPLHAGKAAANGVLAARLAAVGLAGPQDILGPGGALEVLASTVDRDALGLGWPDSHPWELELNTFKTYPCGVVAHPAMDAAIDVFPRLAAAGGHTGITGVTLRCNPLVPELMGLEQPENGLRSRFSARHGVAVGLRYGRAGLAEFSDVVATDPDVARLRGLITLDPSPDVPRDAAQLRIEFGSAPAITISTQHTRGSAARPLSDAEVLDKTRVLFGPVLGEPAADLAWAAIGRLSEAADTSELLTALRPVAGPAVAGSGAVADASAGAQGAGGAGTRTRGAVSAEADAAKTATGEILALAWRAVPTADAKSGLAAFVEAAARGADSTVARGLRAIRPSDASADPAWTAWLTGSAASVAAGESSTGSAASVVAGESSTGSAASVAASGATTGVAVCAAATALAQADDGDPESSDPESSDPESSDRTVTAVAAGVQAAALVESRLADWGGWSGAAVASTIGAAVAAGLTLGLTADQFRNALGIAATQAAGLRAAWSDTARSDIARSDTARSDTASPDTALSDTASTGAGPLQAGKAAFNGVEAALLARAGLTAPHDPLGGRRGLFALFSPSAKVG